MAETLKITALVARGLPKKDVLGSIDAYFIFKVGTSSQQSITVKNSQTPTYNQTFKFEVTNEDEVLVEGYDWDKLSKNDLFATTIVKFRGNKGESWFTLKDKNGKDAGEIKLDIQFPANDVTLKWPTDDDVYVGPAKNNQPDGKGVVKYGGSRQGEVYDGDFADGQKHGKGTFTWPSGDRYSGEYVNNMWDGKGTYTWANGQQYEGDFVKNRQTGKGLWTSTNGQKYEGDFIEGQKTGKGTWTWPDGQTYVGDFVNGSSVGHGVMTKASGLVYDGEWKDDKKEGKGTLTFPDGQKYVGDWKDDQKDGQGIWYWPDEQRYEGEFRHDNIEGHGKKYYADGRVYDGEWKNDKKNGQGTMTDKDGNTLFSGEFIDDIQQG